MNNLFDFATKELTQDAMICWLINWVNYKDSSLYELGIKTLDLFLGKRRLDRYYNVKVIRQYLKIDVLVLFNNNYALIIEDKTNSFEQDDQIARYVSDLSNSSEMYGKEVLTTYVKTGIIYDKDFRSIKKTHHSVTLEDIHNLIMPFALNSQSDIVNSYFKFLANTVKVRENITKMIIEASFAKAFDTAYGQFTFMDLVFCNRTKNTDIVVRPDSDISNKNIALDNEYTIKTGNNANIEEIEPNRRQSEFIDEIYSGSNKGRNIWTQYCFWGEEYKQQFSNIPDYHFLFWRIDTFSRSKKVEYYINLRHYDKCKLVSDKSNERKINFYNKLIDYCDTKYSNREIFSQFSDKSRYMESDVLFIPVRNLSKIGGFEKVKCFFRDITDDITKYANHISKEM